MEMGVLPGTSILCVCLMKRVQTQTMTIYTEAKINRKMAPKLALRIGLPGRFVIALRSILKRLRNAVPNTPGDRF